MERFRKQLLDLRKDLELAEDSGSQAEQTVELDQSRVGRLSRMDAMQSQAMSKETGRRRRRQIREIELALERIDAGDYGFCENCGESINPKRLEVDATARLCISCAEQQE